MCARARARENKNSLSSARFPSLFLASARACFFKSARFYILRAMRREQCSLSQARAYLIFRGKVSSNWKKTSPQNLKEIPFFFFLLLFEEREREREIGESGTRAPRRTLRSCVHARIFRLFLSLCLSLSVETLGSTLSIFCIVPYLLLREL